MPKLVTQNVSFVTKDGRTVSFKKKVRQPPKSSAELKRRLAKVPMALRVQANKMWQAAHSRAGTKNSQSKRHSKVTGRYYPKKKKA